MTSIDKPEKKSLRQLAFEAHLEQDQRRRDDWLKHQASSQVMVGDGITLYDVQRWLREALA